MMENKTSFRRAKSSSSRQTSSTLSRPSSSNKAKAPPTFNRNVSSPKQDLFTTSGYPPETKPKKPASEEQIGKTIDTSEGKWSKRIAKENNSGIAIESSTKDDREKEQMIRDTIVKSNNSDFSGNGDRKLTNKEINGTKRKFKNRGGNIAFAKYDINGKTGKIDSFSGRLNLKGFAPFVEKKDRKLETLEIPKGFDREVDTEVKILEKILRQTIEESVGTIRLFSQRPVCDSCGNVIKQFRKLRPNIKTTVVEGES